MLETFSNFNNFFVLCFKNPAHIDFAHMVEKMYGVDNCVNRILKGFQNPEWVINLSKILPKKNFERINCMSNLPFLGSLSVTPPGDHGGGGTTKIWLYFKRKIFVIPPPVITGGVTLKLPKNGKHWC